MDVQISDTKFPVSSDATLWSSLLNRQVWVMAATLNVYILFHSEPKWKQIKSLIKHNYGILPTCSNFFYRYFEYRKLHTGLTATEIKFKIIYNLKSIPSANNWWYNLCFPKEKKNAMILHFHFVKNLIGVGKMTAPTSAELFSMSSTAGYLS